MVRKSKKVIYKYVLNGWLLRFCYRLRCLLVNFSCRSVYSTVYRWQSSHTANFVRMIKWRRKEHKYLCFETIQKCEMSSSSGMAKRQKKVVRDKCKHLKTSLPIVLSYSNHIVLCPIVSCYLYSDHILQIRSFVIHLNDFFVMTISHSLNGKLFESLNIIYILEFYLIFSVAWNKNFLYLTLTDWT